MPGRVIVLMLSKPTALGVGVGFLSESGFAGLGDFRDFLNPVNPDSGNGVKNGRPLAALVSAGHNGYFAVFAFAGAFGADCGVLG